MTTALVRNADRMMLTATPLAEGIELAFGDGGAGFIPFGDLPEVAAGGGVAGLELPNPYQLVALLANGDRAEIPWDFARHYCDPDYRPRVEAVARRGRATLGRRIREQRQAAGLSQQELAQRSSIGRVTLARVESGKQSPRFNTLSAIAAALGVAVDDLLA